MPDRGFRIIIGYSTGVRDERPEKEHNMAPLNCVPVCAFLSTLLHFEVSVDIGRQVLLVEQEVVSHNVEGQAGAPVGSRVI